MASQEFPQGAESGMFGKINTKAVGEVTRSSLT